MIPQELEAKSGEKILPKFRKLIQWIDSQKLVSVDERISLNTTPNGTMVSVVDRPPSIVTPLLVRLSGTKFFSVVEGYINGKLPQIKPSNGQLQDIIDPDGIPALPAKLPTERPIMICASVVFDDSYRFESSEILCVSPAKIPRAGSANYSAQTQQITGLIPLAFIRSTSLVQFVTHNLQVRAFNYNGTRRVIYWPA
jgi:hypothetical protein